MKDLAQKVKEVDRRYQPYGMQYQSTNHCSYTRAATNTQATDQAAVGLIRFMIRRTNRVSQGDWIFLSANDQPFQDMYMEPAV